MSLTFSSGFIERRQRVGCPERASGWRSSARSPKRTAERWAFEPAGLARRSHSLSRRLPPRHSRPKRTRPDGREAAALLSATRLERSGSDCAEEQAKAEL